MSEKTGTEILMAQSPSIGEVIDRLNRRLAAAQERIKALEKRLEIVPGHPYDGIDCRDETIRLADERIREVEAERDALREDAERLDWFERRCNEGGSPALINDDNGHWAVAEDGIQNCPDGDGPQTITTSFWIEAELWRDSVRAAIDAERARDECL